MPYSITGENRLGKWKLIRPTKMMAKIAADAKRSVSGNKNIRIRKV